MAAESGLTPSSCIQKTNLGARPEYRRLIGLQGTVAVASTVIAYFAVSFLAAKSMAFGGCVVLVSTLFLAWRFRRGKRNESANAEWYLRQAYLTAIERFIWVVVMLVVGFKLLEFEPLWMLVGFLGGQTVWLAAPIWMRVESVK